MRRKSEPLDRNISVVDYTSKQMSEGKKFFRGIKLKARKEAEKQINDINSYLQPKTLLGQRTIENIKEKHIEAVIVYSNKKNEWYADIVLKNTPVGVPNVLGTPVIHPEKTEQDAKKSAYTMLVGLYKNIITQERAKHDQKPKNERVFALQDADIVVSGEYLDAVHNAISEVGLQFMPPKDVLIGRLEILLNQKQTPINHKTFNESSDEWKTHVYLTLTQLLIHGVFKYPENN